MKLPMKTLLGSLVLLLASLAVHAENVTLICIWDVSASKKQSYIVEFDEQKQSVAFNGAPTGEASINADSVRFNLHFPKEVVWSHAINRKDGKMVATKSDAPDPLKMQCGKLVTEGL